MGPGEEQDEHAADRTTEQRVTDETSPEEASGSITERVAEAFVGYAPVPPVEQGGGVWRKRLRPR